MTTPEKDLPIEALSVTALTLSIKKNLETHFFSVSVQGEISNLKIQSSGHIYFSLKDEGASLSAVLFKGKSLPFIKHLKEGASVILKGEINVYPPSGKYQILVHEVKPQGLGDLLQRLELLKKELHKLGYFSKERKKKIPFLPKVIGVVTSPTGAVIQDILHILSRRFPSFQVLLYPVKVQGEGAKEEIAKAISELNAFSLCDVMIIGRGGGSIEDLWPFNERIVAEAIYRSSIPTVCAVGHETDHSVAEYVADLRAPTPSAAAELVLPEKKVLEEKLSLFKKKSALYLKKRIESERLKIKGLSSHPFLRSPYAFLAPLYQTLDIQKEALENGISRFLSQKKKHLDWLRKNISQKNPLLLLTQKKEKIEFFKKNILLTVMRNIKKKEKELLFFQSTLQAIHPKKLLNKGYTILFSEKTGLPITSIQQVSQFDYIQAHLKDGIILSSIQNITKTKEESFSNE